jgi:hypothetical protein
MTNSGLDRLVSDYLQRLDAVLQGVPATEREQIIAEITDHIFQARAALPEETEASIRDLLDQMGDPEVIADAALRGDDHQRPRGHWFLARKRLLSVVGAVVLCVAVGLGTFALTQSSGQAVGPCSTQANFSREGTKLLATLKAHRGYYTLPNGTVVYLTPFAFESAVPVNVKAGHVSTFLFGPVPHQFGWGRSSHTSFAPYWPQDFRGGLLPASTPGLPKVVTVNRATSMCRSTSRT